MNNNVRLFELVDSFEEVKANVKQFHKDLENGTYIVDKLSQFKEWFYIPELDAFGPSKYIGFKQMNAVFYNNGRRTEEQKQNKSIRLNGGASTNRLVKWFRELSREELLFKQLYSKIDSFLSTYNKKPNKALQLYLPKNLKSLDHEITGDQIKKNCKGIENDVMVTLDTLIFKIERIIRNLNEDGSAAFQENNYEQAQKIAENAQEITLFLRKVRELQKEWADIFEKESV